MPPDERLRWLRGCALTVPAALLGVAAAVRLDAWLNLSAWARGGLAAAWLVGVIVAAFGWAAAPPRPLRRLVVPVFAGLLAFLSVAAVPAAGERVRRLFLPFYAPPPDVPFRLVVSSGDPVVRRGEPVTLTAYAEPNRPGAPLPEAAWLVVRDGPARPEQRKPMTADGTGGFRATRDAVDADFEYAVEADGTRSDWHPVRTADPVELDGPATVTVEPPGYAQAARRLQTLTLFADGPTGAFGGLRFGWATLAVRFTRPPADAYLVLNPAPDARGPHAVPLTLAPDRRSGTVAVPLDASRTARVVVLGTHGLRSEYAANVWAVADAPPRFETATGLDSVPRDVRPDATIPVEIAATDDVALTDVRLEWRVNDGPVTAVPLPPGSDPARVSGAVRLDLSGKVRDGDTVSVRVRATDGRKLADRGLGPQDTTVPADGWATFRVAAAAKPLAEQDADADAERTKRVCRSAREFAAKAAEIVRDVARSAGGELTLDERVRLTAARDRVQDALAGLLRFAAEIELVPDLRPLAAAVRGLADGSLAAADAAVGTAFGAQLPQVRDAALSTVLAKLDESAARLERFTEVADRAARARADRRIVSKLVEEQRSLTSRIGEAGFAAAQQAVRGGVADLLGTSPFLAAGATAAEDAARRDLAGRVGKLAADLAALSDAVAATARSARDRELAGLAARQRDFAAAVAGFGTRVDLAARLAGAAPPGSREATEAADLLANGRPADAAVEQEKAARALDRLADTFAAAAAARADAREAARQLAGWHADLRRRTRESTDANAFAVELAAVRAAVERLKLPPGAAAARAARTEFLGGSVESLAKLPDLIPTREDRLRAARAAAEGLLAEQAAVTRLADDAVRPADRANPDGATRRAVIERAAAAAERQDAIARLAEGVDAPGLGHRTAAAAAAARRAAADLRAGLVFDIPLSQQSARRQLDRLRQAAAGATPNDEAAADLAGRQRGIAESLEKGGDSRAARTAQADVSRLLAAIVAPEEAGALADARAAVARAEQASRQGDVAAFRTDAKAAAGALARLADRLTGAEPDVAVVARLASERAAAVIAAKLAPRVPPTADEAAETARLLSRAADDLDHVRAGAAQSARRRAVDALARLRASPEPDRQPALQQAAADALKQLAEQMRKNGDRTAGDPLPPKPPADDPVDGTTGGPPTRADADAARDLARRQRALRDAASKAATDLTHGVRPAAADPLGELAKEQAALAADCERFAEAHELTSDAADRLRVGAADVARESMREAESALATAGATEMRKRQAAILKKLGPETAGDLSFAASRQRNELLSIASRAGDLATALDDAATRQGAAGLSDPFRDAADRLRAARPDLQRAAREADAGRPTDARDARRQAAFLLGRAARTAEKAAPALGDSPPGARAAVESLRTAVERMRAAEAGADASAARAAAEALADADRHLAPLASGVP